MGTYCTARSLPLFTTILAIHQAMSSPYFLRCVRAWPITIVEKNSRLFIRYHFQSRRSLGGSLLNHLFFRFSVLFFVSEYILYPLSNHLSRRILIYLLLGSKFFNSVPTGLIRCTFSFFSKYKYIIQTFLPFVKNYLGELENTLHFKVAVQFEWTFGKLGQESNLLLSF